MRILALATLLLLPLAAAGSTTGSGDAALYLSCTTIATTPGTAFTLTSADGDWDAFFSDGTNFQAVGDETGTVPLGAASVDACLWGGDDPSGLALPVPSLGSTFTYTDG